MFGIMTPRRSIDAMGVSYLANAFLSREKEVNGEEDNLAKVVMLSSAGVTRPRWSDEKKEMFAGCADIPIVRLNPFGILDVKADSEEKLRQSSEYLNCFFFLHSS
uniref:Uncharacterized protein n=2 Tax=Ditylum brightwellii TaxID=49249 RepID=A0A7S4VH39_9STRA|mmetsp:Transcript_47210/g.71405  ORF Transcript_47210/g.71405 Transcript_47210/m.71405 type:complete len:105 (+) Transcript_47210:142-456(+)